MGQTFSTCHCQSCLPVAVAAAPPLFAPFVNTLPILLLPPVILWTPQYSHKSISARGTSLGAAICPGVGVAAVRGDTPLIQDFHNYGTQVKVRVGNETKVIFLLNF